MHLLTCFPLYEHWSLWIVLSVFSSAEVDDSSEESDASEDDEAEEERTDAATVSHQEENDA